MNTLKELQAISDLWYLADKRSKEDPRGRKLADAIRRSAVRREVANIPQRARNWIFYRCMTGRPSLDQFAYSMAKRPSSFVSYYSNLDFAGIKSRFAATMADVYTNRLLGHQTFVSMIPVKGDAEQNAQAQDLEEGIDISDDQLNYQKERTTLCTEAFWYGTGFIKFGDDGQKNPKLTAVNMDELLYANQDDPDPYDVIQRVWAKKTELLEEYKGSKDACEAILRAENAYPAFYFGRGTLDCTDVVPLLEGWTRPLSKSVPGRHVKTIGDYTLVDEPWEYPHPFESWSFDLLPGSLIGQGIAEKLLQISQWIDGLLTFLQDCEARAGRPKWMREENSNVNPDTLGDVTAAVVDYLGTMPTLVTPEAVGQYALVHLKMLMDLGSSIVHVSQAAVKGELPAGITAAIALEKYAQIDDQNFLEKIGRLEDFDKRCAYQKIMLFKRLNARFKSGRRTFDWSTVKLNANFRINDLQAYNVGRLAQTVAGRIQIVEQMYANKRIDGKTYNKFLQTPDIPGMFRDLNAEADDIQKQLDNLVKTAEYNPPTPFMDPIYALKMVETRYAREEADGSSQDVLDRLLMWRATVLSFQKQATTPDVDAPPSEAAGALPPVVPAGFADMAPPQIPGDPSIPALPLAPPPELPQVTNSAVPA